MSFELTGIGPIFVVLGALLAVLPGPLRAAVALPCVRPLARWLDPRALES